MANNGSNGAKLGFENKLWEMADKMWGHMDSGEYTRSKKADTKRSRRDRSGQTLFIDARRMGTLIDRVHRELTDDGVPYGEKMSELSTTLYEQFAQGEKLESAIKKNLEALGYGK